MKGTYIGELEELILLTVGILYGKAYGVAVMDEIVKQTGRESQHQRRTLCLKKTGRKRSGLIDDG